MPPVLHLEASELDDNELEELKNFLEAEDAVDSVSVGYLDMFEESEPQGPIELQAAAAPFILTVHFLQAHWKEIAGYSATATTAVQNAAKLTAWIRKRINAFNESRRVKYDLTPLYDADGNVHKLVKIPRNSKSKF
jgi:hypothetical protein